MPNLNRRCWEKTQRLSVRLEERPGTSVQLLGIPLTSIPMIKGRVAGAVGKRKHNLTAGIGGCCKLLDQRCVCSDSGIDIEIGKARACR